MKLCFFNATELSQSLQFDYNRSIAYYVGAIAFVELDSLIVYWEPRLGFEWHFSAGQLQLQSLLIYRLKKAHAQFAMHLDGCSNYLEYFIAKQHFAHMFRLLLQRLSFVALRDMLLLRGPSWIIPTASAN